MYLGTILPAILLQVTPGCPLPEHSRQPARIRHHGHDFRRLLRLVVPCTDGADDGCTQNDCGLLFTVRHGPQHRRMAGRKVKRDPDFDGITAPAVGR